MSKSLEDYLEHIGLREYAPVFRQNGITSLELLKGLDTPVGEQVRQSIHEDIRRGRWGAAAGATPALATASPAPIPAPAERLAGGTTVQPAPAGPPPSPPRAVPSEVAAEQVGLITAQNIQAWIEAEGKAAVRPWKPDPEAEARQKKLQDAMAEVEKLRAACEAATDADRKTVSEEAASKLDKLLSEFKASGLGTLPSAAELAANVRGEFANLEKALSGLSQLTVAAIQQKDLSVVELIYAHQLLRGHCVTARGLSEAPGGAVLAMPKRCADADLFGPALEALDFGNTYSSESAMLQAERLLETHGSSFAVSALASGAFFTGTGVGAVSASARYAQAREERHERFEESTHRSVTEVQTRYHWSPMRQVVFSTLQFDLSVEALAELRTLLGTGNPQRQRRLAKAFIQAFGSHVFGRVTLGGWYKYTAKATAQAGADRKLLTQAVSTAMDWAASASATYAGLGGAFKASTAAEGKATDTRVSGLQLSKQWGEHNVSITTSTLGGIDGLPREAWIGSIQYAPQWRVIQRAAPYPVWTLIARTNPSQLGTPVASGADKTADKPAVEPQKAIANLAALIEEVWVQDIFAPSFPDMPDMPDTLKLRELLRNHSSPVVTAEGLETFLASELPRLRAPATQVSWSASQAVPLKGQAVGDPHLTVLRNQLVCVFSAQHERQEHKPQPFLRLHDGTQWQAGPELAPASTYSFGVGVLPGGGPFVSLLSRVTMKIGVSVLAKPSREASLQAGHPFAEAKDKTSFPIGEAEVDAVGLNWPPGSAVVTFAGQTWVASTDSSLRIQLYPLSGDGKPQFEKARLMQGTLVAAAPPATNATPAPTSSTVAAPATPAWQAATRTRIATAVFRKTLFLAYRDKEQNTLWLTTSSDAEHWTAPVALQVKGSLHGPSLAAFNGPAGPKLYCAYTGLGPEAPLYVMSSADGLNWDRPVKVRDLLGEQEAARQREADEVFAEDEEGATPTATPRPPAEVHKYVSASGSPALIVHADMEGVALYCFYRAGDGIRYVCYPEHRFDPLAPLA